jgi:t-SNARE complex subunit (syntaxin)
MEDDRIEMTEAQKKARRSRSIALGVVLAALVVLFYVITVVKLGPGLFDRPM